MLTRIRLFFESAIKSLGIEKDLLKEIKQRVSLLLLFGRCLSSRGFLFLWFFPFILSQIIRIIFIIMKIIIKQSFIFISCSSFFLFLCRFFITSSWTSSPSSFWFCLFPRPFPRPRPLLDVFFEVSSTSLSSLLFSSGEELANSQRCKREEEAPLPGLSPEFSHQS